MRAILGTETELPQGKKERMSFVEEIVVREYRQQDLPEMTAIWNQVVEAGCYFPQIEPMSMEEAEAFFAEQSFTGVAVEGDQVLGLYILHPNNIGRCGHICNASYAVKEGCRGRHVGEKLVRHCIKTGPEKGFRVLQFNAVVCTNAPAIHLYEKIGFTRLGTVPGGFQLKDGTYVDIYPYCIEL